MTALRQNRILRIVFLIFLCAVLYLIGRTIGDWALAALDIKGYPNTQLLVRRTIAVALLLYIILLALPFMPGIEIGIAIMVMVGPSISLLIYVCTIAAFLLAFIIGRTVPPAITIRLFKFLHLYTASTLIRDLVPLSPNERLTFISKHIPSRYLGSILNHRYIVLALLVNLPGNALIGGGGGIALAAGMTRLFSFPVFVLTIMIAVAPVPLVFYISGQYPFNFYP